MTLYLLEMILMGVFAYGFAVLMVVRYFWKKHGSTDKEYNGYCGMYGFLYIPQAIICALLTLAHLTVVGFSWQTIVLILVSCGIGFIGLYYLREAGKFKLAVAMREDELDKNNIEISLDSSEGALVEEKLEEKKE